jgi:TRAP-type mannitol/chloroaromatic compound transport system permease small subunit
MTPRGVGVILGWLGCIGVAVSLASWLMFLAGPPILYISISAGLFLAGAWLAGRALFSRLGYVYGAITIGLNAIGTVLILLMAIAVNSDILGRELFRQPVPGVTEFIGLSIVAVVFLQMANTLREERHVSNDLILSAVARGRPRVAAFFYGLFHLIGAALMGFIAWYVYPIFRENYLGDFYKGTAGVIEIPVWPFMAVVLVGAVATIGQYLILAGREFARAFGAGALGRRSGR